MNKLFVILILGLMLVSCVTSYSCIYRSDNLGVRNFKNRLNVISVNQDIESGLSEQAIIYKLKYFSPCR